MAKNISSLFPAEPEPEESMEVEPLPDIEATEIESPRRTLDESTRLLLESYSREEKIVQHYAEELFVSGRELYAVKQNTTYGEKAYTNFNTYCSEELPYHNTTARRRILFYQVTQAARDLGLPEPTSLEQMNALRSAAPNDTDRVALWLSLVRGGEPVTPKAIGDHVIRPDHDDDLDRTRYRQELEYEYARRRKLEVRLERLEREDRDYRAVLDELNEVRRERQEWKESERARLLGLIEPQFIEEVAAIKARYGDEEEPTFAEIGPEDWARALKNAKSQRVMDVTRHLNEMYAWPEWMGQYFPDEAADAIEDMERGDDLVEGLEFARDWLDRLLKEVENRAS